MITGCEEQSNDAEMVHKSSSIAFNGMVRALKKCVSVFEQLADAGNYPKPLLNNGGWLFAAEALAKASSLSLGVRLPAPQDDNPREKYLHEPARTDKPATCYACGSALSTAPSVPLTKETGLNSAPSKSQSHARPAQRHEGGSEK